MDEKIEEIASKAREILRKIPFAEKEQIDFQTVEYGEPTVTYESSGCGFVQVVNERGQERPSVIAGSFEEMVNYFVDSAITDYAYRYELAHRRRFESNLRQTDEVREACYHYIDPGKKCIRRDYDDTPHIYLDLFAAYRSICLKYREENAISCQPLKDDIDYIADRKYTDTPGGGMYSLKASMEKVRERTERIGANSSELREAFWQYEKYYRLLKEMK